MAAQTKFEKLRRVNDYLIKEARTANKLLRIEKADGIEYAQNYKDGLDGDIKTHETNIIKILRWLISDLGVQIPAAFTDNEIDAIDPEIRNTLD